MPKHKLDMTNVEEYVLCDEGIHLAKIISFEEKTASTGTEMETGCFEVISGPSTGARVYENFPLTQKARFKIKKLLKALGLPHEGKNVTFDTDKMTNMKVAIEVSQYEYEGKTKARIEDFHPAAAAGAKKASKPNKTEEPEPEEEAEEEEELSYDDMTPKDLYSLCKERDIEVKPKLEKAVYIKKLKKWDEEHAEAADDDDEWADDDE